MRPQTLIILVLLLTISCQNSDSLFQENQKDWIEEGNAHWNFSNKELIGKVNDEVGFVMTKQTYKDFVLEMEFKPDSTINSGIYIRCKNFEINAEDCYEVNLWDLHPNQDFRTGAIVLKFKPIAIVETINKWNTYKIKIEKDHLEVWINGIITSDLRDSTRSEGHIGLQASGVGKIKFRNIKISAL